jgi:hypothetical protein
MTVFVYRNGELVEKHLAAPKHEGGEAPYVISDIMGPTRHMATGRMHTSKAEFRKDTKASGCIEIGNDPAIMRPRKPIPLDRGQRREAIRKSIYDIRNGRVPT